MEREERVYLQQVLVWPRTLNKLLVDWKIKLWKLWMNGVFLQYFIDKNKTIFCDNWRYWWAGLTPYAGLPKLASPVRDYTQYNTSLLTPPPPLLRPITSSTSTSSRLDWPASSYKGDKNWNFHFQMRLEDIGPGNVRLTESVTKFHSNTINTNFLPFTFYLSLRI